MAFLPTLLRPTGMSWQAEKSAAPKELSSLTAPSNMVQKVFAIGVGLACGKGEYKICSQS